MDFSMEVLQRQWKSNILPAFEAILFARGVGATVRMSPIGSGDPYEVSIVGTTVNAAAMTKEDIETTIFVASAKHAELLASGARSTPAIDNKWATGYVGGLVVDSSNGSYMVSVSGLPASHDAALAAIALLGPDHQIYVNHYGMRFARVEDYDAQASRLIAQYGTVVNADTDDRYRAFCDVGPTMLEIEWHHGAHMPHAIMHHIDLAVQGVTPIVARDWLHSTITQAPVEAEKLDFKPMSSEPSCGLVIYDANLKRDHVLVMHLRPWEDRDWRPEGLD